MAAMVLVDYYHVMVTLKMGGLISCDGYLDDGWINRMLDFLAAVDDGFIAKHQNPSTRGHDWLKKAGL